MKNKFVNFVDYLNKNDIKTLLGLMGYRLIEEKDNEDGLIKEEAFNNKLKLRIARIKDEEAPEEHKIMCICKRLNEEEMEKLKISLPRDMVKNILTLNLFLTAFGSGSSFSAYNEIKFVTIENFFAYETLCFDNEVEETFKNCTKVLDEYMTKKFGSFYQSQKKKYISKLRKEVAKEEAEKQAKEENEEQAETLAE